MANGKNLKTPSTSEARENGRKGGKASGKARRKKANLKKAFEILLESNVKNEALAKKLEEMGFDGTNEMALAIIITQKALKGDIRAFKEISNIVAKKDRLDIEEQQEKIKLIRKQAESGGEAVNIPIFINDMRELEDE